MWSNIRGRKYELLKTIKIISEYKSQKSFNGKIFELKNNIHLKNISFKYPESEEYIFKNIDLEIKKGDCLGIVGQSGSGKSTLADILMTLQFPNEGQYLLDNNDLYDKSKSINLQNWRSSIAQVPQKIFLSDATISENIAFGIDKEKIDTDRLYLSAKLSSLDEYINSLPLKYDSIVGESGAFLSGGQIQRMAIARALYKGAQLLILDEATSSLDNKTEDSIINSIKKIKGKVTIIFISHRSRTLDICDKIIEIDRGKLIKKI